MVEITDKSNCTGCTACVSICAHNAIKMQFDSYGHSYPHINKNACIDCKLCEKVCPLQHREEFPNDKKGVNDLQIYAAYNKDTVSRSKSTSGGIFTILARYVINMGGIVYAARFDDNYHIYHSCFTSIDEIGPFRGSKYAQSELGSTFKDIRKDLKSRPVLFVGTPCQVAGLKRFLVNDYPNLYTCDFICMCIASPIIWEKYLNEYWNIKDIKHVWFKDKRNGWHNWRMLIEDTKGEHLIKGNEDPFFRSYLSHLISRPSCNFCAFRSLHRVSDFTIADCWGIEKEAPEFDDNKGCTTIILQNKKASSVFAEISDSISFITYPSFRIIENNPYSVKDFMPNKDSQRFYDIYRTSGLRTAFESVYNKPTQKMSFKNLIGKIFSNICN